jgi:hypothetical protein
MRLAAGLLLLSLSLAPSSAFAQDIVELRGGLRNTGALGEYHLYGYGGADVEVVKGVFAGADFAMRRDAPGTGPQNIGMLTAHGGFRYPGRLGGLLQAYARVGAGRVVWKFGTGLVMGGVGANVWFRDSVAAHFDFQRLKVLDADVGVPLNVFSVGVTLAPSFLRWRNR